MKKRLYLLLAAFGVVVCSAAPAFAELAFFANGHSVSIREHHLEGDRLVLSMRSGGSIVCELSTIVRFAPDEVPYPEPEAAAGQQSALLAVPFGDIIDRVSAEQNIEAKIVRAVIKVESAYNKRARSRKGAMGLMQLMPDTARQYAVADPYDPVSNIEAGVKHLKTLLQRLPLDLALAAYNAGEAAVQKFHGIPPYPETRDYVSRILGLLGR